MSLSAQKLTDIKSRIIELAIKQGFQAARVCDTDTSKYFPRYLAWLSKHYHGDMSYLQRNQQLREFPEKLHPNTTRIISLRYNYLPANAGFTSVLENPDLANISRYALGKDYHKHLRKKLKSVCEQISKELAKEFQLDYRVFVDSAPVLETAFAEKSGLGWKGKHTLLINEHAGSWFFLGEIFINLPLPVDPPAENLCGSCTACINLCPTNAILPDNQIDATRCISYLTIENQSEIPKNLRPLIGNRIYGCDDCQLACPWNRYAALSDDQAFMPFNNLNQIELLGLWQWSEEDFLNNFLSSPIRRIGYQNWLRNLAVAIGNANYSEQAVNLLKNKKPVANNLVREHIDWAIEQLCATKNQPTTISPQTQKLINCVTNMLPRDA